MPIYVTRPSMPELDEFVEEIRPIFEGKILTNMGPMYKKFQRMLMDYLEVPELSLFTNGHLALELGIQALGLKQQGVAVGGGEVITTPYTFVSTTHAICRNNLKPVFCDIRRSDYCMDPDLIEGLITDKTVAILPVHVYGNLCDAEKIRQVAKKHGLKVIYDGAHAFGERYDGESVGKFGDATMFSFHATKVFNTIEGGAMVMHDAEMKKRIDYLKNFGFAGETTVVGPGINSKMDEMRSAYGLLNLKQVDSAIEARHTVAIRYRDALRDVPGITFFDDIPGVRHNYAYFPIFVDPEKYGMTRDELYFKMKDNGVLGRRYFYPLISSFSTYSGLPSAAPENLPQAHKMADSVICLPMHHELKERDSNLILSLVVR